MELNEVRSKLGTEKRQVESQLRTALSQNNELEEKLALLTTEIERLRNVIRDLRDDSDRWKTRAEDLEKELETTRISVELQVRQAVVRNYSLGVSKRFLIGKRTH